MARKHRIEMLLSVAANIAALRDDGARSGSDIVQTTANRLADYLTAVIDDIAGREGMLVGEMPWWTERSEA